MQGVIAETVQLMELPLIHRLLPVDVEGTLHNGRHLIHIIRVEGDDAQSQNVGNVIERPVFVAFKFQFAPKRVFLFDAMLNGGDIDTLLPQCVTQMVVSDFLHPLIDGDPVMVLLA